VAGFAPRLNAQVKALAVSPDHKTLYVGGSFTQVGATARSHFAAFNLTTGGLRKLAPKANLTVNAITATKKTVYFGGSFSAVDGKLRSRLASVSVSTRKLTSWAPVANGGVQAMTLTTDQTSVIAGGSFTKLNGKAALGMGSLNPKTGATKTWKINKVVKDSGPNAAILSLKASGTKVFGSGYTFGAGNFEGAFAASAKDGKVTWLQDCHGDTYDVAPIGDIVYSVGHPHYCKNIGGYPDTSPRTIWRRALAVTRAATGTVAKNGQPTYWGGTRKYGNFQGQPAPTMYDWFPEIAIGTYTGMAQGAWSITGNKTYISIGGEFPKVNGIAQQGLVRMAIPTKAPNAAGPVDHSAATTPTAVLQASGTVTVSWLTNWDRDDLKLTYTLKRDDALVYTSPRQASTEWSRPILTRADAVPVPLGGTVTYTVTATDPEGNSVTSGPVSVTRL
jgi:hypothetical protein